MARRNSPCWPQGSRRCTTNGSITAPAFPARPPRPCRCPISNPHLIRSADGRAAVWLGTVDDLWSFGKPSGVGGPWKNSTVTANAPSDPYLLTGYDRKKITVSHTSSATVRIRVEVDLSGTGLWVTYTSLAVPAGQSHDHTFPAGYQAYWLRVTADTSTTATAQLTYE